MSVTRKNEKFNDGDLALLDNLISGNEKKKEENPFDLDQFLGDINPQSKLTTPFEPQSQLSNAGQLLLDTFLNKTKQSSPKAAHYESPSQLEDNWGEPSPRQNNHDQEFQRLSHRQLSALEEIDKSMEDKPADDEEDLLGNAKQEVDSDLRSARQQYDDEEEEQDDGTPMVQDESDGTPQVQDASSSDNHERDQHEEESPVKEQELILLHSQREDESKGSFAISNSLIFSMDQSLEQSRQLGSFMQKEGELQMILESLKTDKERDSTSQVQVSQLEQTIRTSSGNAEESGQQTITERDPLSEQHSEQPSLSQEPVYIVYEEQQQQSADEQQDEPEPKESTDFCDEESSAMLNENSKQILTQVSMVDCSYQKEDSVQLEEAAEVEGPLIEEEIQPVLEEQKEFTSLKELANQVVNPKLEETANFESSQQEIDESMQFSRDSAYFTRNQMVTDKASYGEPTVAKSKDVFAQKMLEQFGEVLPQSSQGSEANMSFAPKDDENSQKLADDSLAQFDQSREHRKVNDSLAQFDQSIDQRHNDSLAQFDQSIDQRNIQNNSLAQFSQQNDSQYQDEDKIMRVNNMLDSIDQNNQLFGQENSRYLNDSIQMEDMVSTNQMILRQLDSRVETLPQMGNENSQEESLETIENQVSPVKQVHHHSYDSNDSPLKPQAMPLNSQVESSLEDVDQNQAVNDDQQMTNSIQLSDQGWGDEMDPDQMHADVDYSSNVDQFSKTQTLQKEDFPIVDEPKLEDSWNAQLDKPEQQNQQNQSAFEVDFEKSLQSINHEQKQSVPELDFFDQLQNKSSENQPVEKPATSNVEAGWGDEEEFEI